MPKTNNEAEEEIKRIFSEAKQTIYSLHAKKMELIKKFKNATDAKEAADILNKLKALR